MSDDRLIEAAAQRVEERYPFMVEHDPPSYWLRSLLATAFEVLDEGVAVRRSPSSAEGSDLGDGRGLGA